MKLNGKRIDLPTLKQQATAAGVVVGDLGTAGDELVTYDAQGHTIDVPAGMAAVLAAHTPPAPPTPASYGSDAADLDQQAAQAATQLRAFVAAATPTNAEVVAAVKLQARVILALMRRGGL